MPNSSLAHYLNLALHNFGTPCSSYHLNTSGIEFESLFSDLRSSQEKGTPYAILGASFSIVHLLDEMSNCLFEAAFEKVNFSLLDNCICYFYFKKLKM